MVIKKINKSQAELDIRTHDFNVLENHISRFVVEFIEECFPILGIKEKKKNKKKRRSTLLSSMSYVKITCLRKNRPY